MTFPEINNGDKLSFHPRNVLQWAFKDSGLELVTEADVAKKFPDVASLMILPRIGWARLREITDWAEAAGYPIASSAVGARQDMPIMWSYLREAWGVDESEAWIEMLKDAIDTIATASLVIPEAKRDEWWNEHRALVESRARKIMAEEVAEAAKRRRRPGR